MNIFKNFFSLLIVFFIILGCTSTQRLSTNELKHSREYWNLLLDLTNKCALFSNKITDSSLEKLDIDVLKREYVSIKDSNTRLNGYGKYEVSEVLKEFISKYPGIEIKAKAFKPGENWKATENLFEGSENGVDVLFRSLLLPVSLTMDLTKRALTKKNVVIYVLTNRGKVILKINKSEIEWYNPFSFLVDTTYGYKKNTYYIEDQTIRDIISKFRS